MKKNFLIMLLVMFITSCNIKTREIILIESFPIKDSKDCGCVIRLTDESEGIEAIDRKCRLRKSYQVGDTILVDLKFITNER